MSKFGTVFDSVFQTVSKHSPAILTGLACAGVVVTAIIAVKEGPKIKEVIDRHKDDMDELKDVYSDEESDMTEEDFKKEKNEIVGRTAKGILRHTAPIVIFVALSIAAAIASNKESARRIAAVSAAYEIASLSLKNQTEAIEELVPKKADEIKEAVTKKKMDATPTPTDEKYIYSTGKGDILCKDVYTGVCFRSSHEEIARAINKISKMCMAEGWVTVADLYYELGIKKIPAIATDIGWHDNDLIEGSIEAHIITTWDDSGTIPVIGLDYEVDPFFKEGGRFRNRY